MNMILLYEKDFIGEDTVCLKDHRHEHIRVILKAQAGDTLKVGWINGRLGKGSVIESGNTGTVLKISSETDPVSKMPVTVIAALPRPLVFRRTLSALTSLGIGRMIFIQSARVEKSYWNSPAIQEEPVRRAVESGLEQAQDTVPPQISFVRRLKPFIEDALPDIVKGKSALIAHPGIAASPCPVSIGGESVVAVGPEGGFTDHEVTMFLGVGFKAVHLGSRILRVETALAVLIGRIMDL
jgi:16S rRNA (uracil1498-N3)-methyltransferase